MRLGQLGGFGQAALGYSEDDLACSPPSTGASRPDVTASSATPAASSCHPLRSAPGPDRAGPGPRAGAGAGARVLRSRRAPGGRCLRRPCPQPGQRGGDVELRLGRVIPVVVLELVGFRSGETSASRRLSVARVWRASPSLARARPSCAVAWMNALPDFGAIRCEAGRRLPPAGSPGGQYLPGLRRSRPPRRCARCSPVSPDTPFAVCDGLGHVGDLGVDVQLHVAVAEVCSASARPPGPPRATGRSPGRGPACCATRFSYSPPRAGSSRTRRGQPARSCRRPR